MRPTAARRALPRQRTTAPFGTGRTLIADAVGHDYPTQGPRVVASASAIAVNPCAANGSAIRSWHRSNPQRDLGNDRAYNGATPASDNSPPWATSSPSGSPRWTHRARSASLCECRSDSGESHARILPRLPTAEKIPQGLSRGVSGSPLQRRPPRGKMPQGLPRGVSRSHRPRAEPGSTASDNPRPLSCQYSPRKDSPTIGQSFGCSISSIGTFDVARSEARSC